MKLCPKCQEPMELVQQANNLPTKVWRCWACKINKVAE